MLGLPYIPGSITIGLVPLFWPGPKWALHLQRRSFHLTLQWSSNRKLCLPFSQNNFAMVKIYTHVLDKVKQAQNFLSVLLCKNLVLFWYLLPMTVQCTLQAFLSLCSTWHLWLLSVVDGFSTVMPWCEREHEHGGCLSKIGSLLFCVIASS